jgi:hypothetical protein
MKLTKETTVGTVFIDPILDTATLVFQGTVNITGSFSWVDMTFSTPFVLPPEYNLLVYVLDSSGLEITNLGFSFSTLSSNNALIGNRNMPIVNIDKLFVTRFGIVDKDVHPGHNLSMVFMEPQTHIEELCKPDYLPVTIILQNTGEENYDFWQDAVSIEMEITDPLQVKHNYSTSIQSDVLQTKESDTINIASAVPFIHEGNYAIKAWVISPVDRVPFDDTVYYVYHAGNLSLPIDENFSNASPVYLSIPLVGNDKWEPYTPNPTEQVQPNQGNGTNVLRFNSSGGAMSRMSTYRFDLYGMYNSKLGFWYYHDMSIPATDNSYTDVFITADGIPERLMTLYKRAGNGWQYYTVDLTKYTLGSQCLSVHFEAMNKQAGSQYIDRVIVKSDEDLSVYAILLTPTVSVCDMDGKDLNVMLINTINQRSDLTNTQLAVKVTGYPDFMVTLPESLESNSVDTIFVASNLTIKRESEIKAYLTVPIDNNPSNDTAKQIIDIRPALTVSAIETSSAAHPVPAETAIHQRIIVQNTGNVEIPAIKASLTVLVQGIPVETIEEIRSIPLGAGNSLTYDFNKTYTVPWNSYSVIATVSMACDSTVTATAQSIQEYINWYDLRLIEITNPVFNVKDNSGDEIYVEVVVENKQLQSSFTNVPITLLIEKSNGENISTITDVIPEVEFDSQDTFRFAQPYTVPSESRYIVVVYITPGDVYLSDDTIRMSRNATTSIESVDGLDIGLGQNIPNPANNSAEIHYRIPTDGSVTFNIYSIAGQVLYSQTVETTFGVHSIEWWDD